MLNTGIFFLQTENAQHGMSLRWRKYARKQGVEVFLGLGANQGSGFVKDQLGNWHGTGALSGKTCIQKCLMAVFRVAERGS